MHVLVDRLRVSRIQKEHVRWAAGLLNICLPPTHATSCDYRSHWSPERLAFGDTMHEGSVNARGIYRYTTCFSSWIPRQLPRPKMQDHFRIKKAVPMLWNAVTRDYPPLGPVVCLSLDLRFGASRLRSSGRVVYI